MHGQRWNQLETFAKCSSYHDNRRQIHSLSIRTVETVHYMKVPSLVFVAGHHRWGTEQASVHWVALYLSAWHISVKGVLHFQKLKVEKV